MIARLLTIALPGAAFAPASDADLDTVYALRREAFTPLTDTMGTGWDDAGERAKFEARWKAATTVLVLRDGAAIGALELDPAAEAWFARTVHLAPQTQGSGLGSAIMRAVVTAAREEGRTVQLSVVRANAGAKALYLKLGFVVEREDGERVWMKGPTGLE